MSPDREFQDPGHKTRISYQEAFIKYKGFLSEDTTEMNNIISYYTQELFDPPSKKPVRSATTSDAIDLAFDQLRRGLYGNTADPVAEEVPPPPSSRKSSAQPEDHSTPAPASPTQSESHVSISVTSSIARTVTISNTTNNNPSTGEHDAEERSPPPNKKASKSARKKKEKAAPKSPATANASGSDADNAPPAPAKKRNANKRGKVPPVAAPSERPLRNRK